MLRILHRLDTYPALDKRLEVFEMYTYCRMLKIPWTQFRITFGYKNYWDGGQKFPLDFEILFFFEINLVSLSIINYDNVGVQIKVILVLGLLCHNSNLKCCF